MFEKYNLTKPSNLVELFESSIKNFPDKTCLGTKNKEGEYEWVTYREMGRRIDNLRGGLSSIGLKMGDAVGIISNNSVDWAERLTKLYPRGLLFPHNIEPLPGSNRALSFRTNRQESCKTDGSIIHPGLCLSFSICLP